MGVTLALAANSLAISGEHVFLWLLVHPQLPTYVDKRHLLPHHVYTVCGHIHTTQSHICRRAAAAAPKDGPANMIFGEFGIVSYCKRVFTNTFQDPHFIDW